MNQKINDATVAFLKILNEKDIGGYCVCLALLVIAVRDTEGLNIKEIQCTDEPVSVATNKMISAISWCLWLILNTDYNSGEEKTKIITLIKEIHKLLRFNSIELIECMDRNVEQKETERVILNGFR